MINYKKPRESGRVAFLQGVKINENPVDRRFNANAHYEWIEGWRSGEGQVCIGVNCKAKNGDNHSIECINEHEKHYT